MFGPTSALTPFATMLQRVDVQPGVGFVQHRDLGLEHAIWRISTRFFSPPEKPSFRYRDASSRGTLSSSIAASSSVRNSGIGTGSSSPLFAALRCALIALRRKLVTVTPGIACGYWNARKRPR